MRRFRKLLWMIFIFWVVFFIICDEKWYKIWFEDNQIIFEKIEKKSDFVELKNKENIVYKDSNIIQINPEFKNPKSLRKSDGINPEYLAKLKQEKDLNKEKNKNQEKIYTWPSIVNFDENNSISSVFQWIDSNTIDATKNNKRTRTWVSNQKVSSMTWRSNETESKITQNIVNTWSKITTTWSNNQKSNSASWKTQEIKIETIRSNNNTWPTWKNNSVINPWKTDQLKHETREIKTEIEQTSQTSENKATTNSWWMNTIQTWKLETQNKAIVYYTAKEFNLNNFTLNLSKWKINPKIKIEKYPWKWNLTLNMKDSSFFEPIVLYKTTRRIKIYTWFENPQIMRNSSWINKNITDNQQNIERTPIISLKNNDTISNAWLADETKTWHIHEETSIEFNESDKNKENFNNDNPEKTENKSDQENDEIETTSWSKNNLYTIEKIDFPTHELTIKNWVYKAEESELEPPRTWTINNFEDFWSDYKTWIDNARYSENINEIITWNTTNNLISNDFNPEELAEIKYVLIEKPELFRNLWHLYYWKEPEIVFIRINKFPTLKRHLFSMKKWVSIKYNFNMEREIDQDEPEVTLSSPMVEWLLENEEIDINTLESENDEFLQKVFQTTKDRDVMNLIVETYLNEYQFVKAKNFIENLPEMYKEDLKPSLNLRVAFNSFSLSSKNISENLTNLVQDFSYKNKISKEDENWYLWIIELMNRNYDKFFEIATWFTSEKYISFTSKLQWYKDQISKQMWMPEYYFDTLASLELFNQWLFQPAKVLALYSLQQNSNYILPYQVLAYANFLTNSRDTSVEYLKKLIDLDPNNAEKYRFLMWVAFYRNEKYEQSVVTLSMIKSDKLRLDAQRYLISNYLLLDQKNKLISSWNKLLWYNNLVASDFYTYFYETFFRPYAEWQEFQIYAFDTELANKMIRVCGITLPKEDRVVCTYWSIGKNIAVWQFDWLEQYLLNLVAEYPQWYLYQALWDYYIQQWDLEKAKIYLLKAISLTREKSERSQIKKLLQDTM